MKPKCQGPKPQRHIFQRYGLQRHWQQWILIETFLQNIFLYYFIIDFSLVDIYSKPNKVMIIVVGFPRIVIAIVGGLAL